MSDSFASRASAVNSTRAGWGGSARNGVCPACLAELRDPRARRHRYPFIACPECGPGYTITHRLPFSRSNTTMAPFQPCEACRREYEDPASRHFGSPTVCCPDCGPSYWIEPSPPWRDEADVVEETVRLLRDHRILALKDTCSFRLIARADDDALVERLRRRTDRPGVPLGVMVMDLAMAHALAEVDEAAEQLLTAPSAPMVLLPLRDASVLAPSVTAGADEVALMLPRAPIHHLVLQELGVPLVVTRAARRDDVGVLENEDAREELMDIADHLVLHDLDLHAGCEDSVLRVETTGPVVLKRASGFAPRPIALPVDAPAVLGIGGRHDVTVALAHGHVGHLSQPVGDLLSARAHVAFERTLERMLSLWDCEPEIVAFDPAREAVGRALAARFGAEPLAVDHHHAHVAGVLAEHGRTQAVLGLSLDATGHDLDPELGSGRLLAVDGRTCEVVERIPGFRVPCADAGPRDPWRVAVGLLHDLLDPVIAKRWAERLAPDAQSARTVLSMLESGAGCTHVQSFGRLYDAAAALLGVARRTAMEGQAAARLELLAGRPGAQHGVAWAPALDAPRAQLSEWVALLVERAQNNGDLADDARWVQVTLARWAADWALRAARARGATTIAAAGGCLTNAWLRHVLVRRVPRSGVELLLNREIPSGDGGLALGQIWVAIQPASAAPRG